MKGDTEKWFGILTPYGLVGQLYVSARTAMDAKERSFPEGLVVQLTIKMKVL